MRPDEKKAPMSSLTPDPSPILKVDEETDREIRIERAAYMKLLDEWKALKQEKAAWDAMPVRPPIIAKPLPPNYVVYLGPEPPPNAELRMSARGRVVTIPDSKEYASVDGDGDGKPKTVRRTTNVGHTGQYVEDGYSDIYFEHRCPSGHKYAGRLWAEILCPEHAAWLHLTRGRDSEGHRMFVFHLLPDVSAQYVQLRDSNMRKLRQTDREIEEIMTRGEPMPEAALAG